MFDLLSVGYIKGDDIKWFQTPICYYFAQLFNTTISTLSGLYFTMQLNEQPRRRNDGSHLKSCHSNITPFIKLSHFSLKWKFCSNAYTKGYENYTNRPDAGGGGWTFLTKCVDCIYHTRFRYFSNIKVLSPGLLHKSSASMTTGVCPKVPVTNSYNSHSCLKPPSRGSNGSLGPEIKQTDDPEESFLSNKQLH